MTECDCRCRSVEWKQRRRCATSQSDVCGLKQASGQFKTMQRLCNGACTFMW
jgi:hypothetical protein